MTESTSLSTSAPRSTRPHRARFLLPDPMIRVDMERTSSWKRTVASRFRWGHLSETWVGVGQHVEVGDEIGATGNTGSSTGPHLHLRIHSGGAVDPMSFLSSIGACDTGSSIAPAPAPAQRT